MTPFRELKRDCIGAGNPNVIQRIFDFNSFPIFTVKVKLEITWIFFSETDVLNALGFTIRNRNEEELTIQKAGEDPFTLHDYFVETMESVCRGYKMDMRRVPDTRMIPESVFYYVLVNCGGGEMLRWAVQDILPNFRCRRPSSSFFKILDFEETIPIMILSCKGEMWFALGDVLRALALETMSEEGPIRHTKTLIELYDEFRFQLPHHSDPRKVMIDEIGFYIVCCNAPTVLDWAVEVALPTFRDAEEIVDKENLYL